MLWIVNLVLGNWPITYAVLSQNNDIAKTAEPVLGRTFFIKYPVLTEISWSHDGTIHYFNQLEPLMPWLNFCTVTATANCERSFKGYSTREPAQTVMIRVFEKMGQVYKPQVCSPSLGVTCKIIQFVNPHNNFKIFINISRTGFSSIKHEISILALLT